MAWITEDNVIEQEIEDIEMERYANKIRATEKFRNLRQIYENQEIRKLFNESQ